MESQNQAQRQRRHVQNAPPVGAQVRGQNVDPVAAAKPKKLDKQVKSSLNPEVKEYVPTLKTKMKILKASEKVLKEQLESTSTAIFNVITAGQEKKKAARQSVGKVNSEQLFLKDIKPLFKEWLEVRDLFHDLLGPYLHLPDGASEGLLKRIKNLRSYLRKVVISKEQVKDDTTLRDVKDRLFDFIDWLKVRRF